MTMMTPELQRARAELEAQDKRMRDQSWRVAWDGHKLHIRAGVTERDVDAMIDRLNAFKDQVLKAQAHTVILATESGRILHEGHRERRAKSDTTIDDRNIEAKTPT